jgi:hypothetical protein
LEQILELEHFLKDFLNEFLKNITNQNEYEYSKLENTINNFKEQIQAIEDNVDQPPIVTLQEVIAFQKNITIQDVKDLALIGNVSSLNNPISKNYLIPQLKKAGKITYDNENYYMHLNSIKQKSNFNINNTLDIVIKE